MDAYIEKIAVPEWPWFRYRATLLNPDGSIKEQSPLFIIHVSAEDWIYANSPPTRPTILLQNKPANTP